MTESTQLPDPSAVVARYAPSAASLAAEWDAARMDVALATILDSAPGVDASGTDVEHQFQLRFLPTHATGGRHRWSRALPVAASVAALVVGAGVLIGTVGSGDSTSRVAAGGSTTASGPAFTPPAGLTDTSIDPGQYSYRVTDEVDHGIQTTLVRDYVAYNGELTTMRTRGRGGSCQIFRGSADGGSGEPGVSFFAALPTDVDALGKYLRSHAEGSSSLDESVFVAVGDDLRTADGLASPKLRAAMLAVLSRTPGVYVHPDAHDALGRPAIRADFVDQPIRPGEVHAYYFDPTTFQFLEESFGHNSAPQSYDGPSPAYSAHAADNADDPDQLVGETGFVMRSETVVDSLPASAKDCGPPN